MFHCCCHLFLWLYNNKLHCSHQQYNGQLEGRTVALPGNYTAWVVAGAVGAVAGVAQVEVEEGEAEEEVEGAEEEEGVVG